MNNIQIFECQQFGQIRTMTDDNGEPWFVGKDVATVLGYERADNAIRLHVFDDDKLMHQISASGQNRNMIIINESGLYSLILSSKLPQAREFKHWVTSVVLPQIRKTGGYIPIDKEDDEKTILCKAVQIMQRTIEQKDALLLEQAPKVMFADAITACDDAILIRDLAKLITQNGVEVGQNRLFAWMRKKGYLFQQQTRPIQKWVERGLFVTNVTLVDTHHGSKERCTTMVTGKGQRYFIDGFLTGRFNIDDIKIDDVNVSININVSV